MPIKAKPFGHLEKFDWGSDIHSVHYDGSLVVQVLRNRNASSGIEITFSTAYGFRLLDELALAHYWVADDFPSGYPVLEVLDGGWAQEEDQRLGHVEVQREWIIVTGGACVSIFSPVAPTILEGQWPG